MWLDHRSARLFDVDFISCNVQQQKQILDEIAFPNDVAPELAQGAEFFSRMEINRIRMIRRTLNSLILFEIRENGCSGW